MGDNADKFALFFFESFGGGNVAEKENVAGDQGFAFFEVVADWGDA